MIKICMVYNIWVSMCVSMMCAYMYALYMYMDMSVICACVYVYMCVSICACMCVCNMYMCMCVCMCVCVLSKMATRSIIYTSYYIDSPLIEGFICEKAIRISPARPHIIKMHNEQH